MASPVTMPMYFTTRFPSSSFVVTTIMISFLILTNIVTNSYM